MPQVGMINEGTPCRGKVNHIKAVADALICIAPLNLVDAALPWPSPDYLRLGRSSRMCHGTGSLRRSHRRSCRKLGRVLWIDVDLHRDLNTSSGPGTGTGPRIAWLPTMTNSYWPVISPRCRLSSTDTRTSTTGVVRRERAAADPAGAGDSVSAAKRASSPLTPRNDMTRK
jgi:hypothetical protein